MSQPEQQMEEEDVDEGSFGPILVTKLQVRVIPVHSRVLWIFRSFLLFCVNCHYCRLPLKPCCSPGSRHHTTRCQETARGRSTYYGIRRVYAQKGPLCHQGYLRSQSRQDYCRRWASIMTQISHSTDKLFPSFSSEDCSSRIPERHGNPSAPLRTGMHHDWF